MKINHQRLQYLIDRFEHTNYQLHNPSFLTNELPLAQILIYFNDSETPPFHAVFGMAEFGQLIEVIAKEMPANASSNIRSGEMTQNCYRVANEPEAHQMAAYAAVYYLLSTKAWDYYANHHLGSGFTFAAVCNPVAQGNPPTFDVYPAILGTVDMEDIDSMVNLVSQIMNAHGIQPVAMEA